MGNLFSYTPPVYSRTEYIRILFHALSDAVIYPEIRRQLRNLFGDAAVIIIDYMGSPTMAREGLNIALYALSTASYAECLQLTQTYSSRITLEMFTHALSDIKDEMFAHLFVQAEGKIRLYLYDVYATMSGTPARIYKHHHEKIFWILVAYLTKEVYKYAWSGRGKCTVTVCVYRLDDVNGTQINDRHIVDWIRNASSYDLMRLQWQLPRKVSLDMTKGKVTDGGRYYDLHLSWK